jgi:D-arabinose 1-dehydrogenase-like Zn-dependent alcohol dehydrogenase
LLLGVGLVVLAAGCGGGKKAAANKIGATGGLGVTGTGGTGHIGITDTGATGPSGVAGFASSKNCLAFAGLAAKIASASSTSGSPTTSPETALRELQALADAAPSEIKGDIQTVAAAFSGFVQTLKNSGYKFGSNSVPTPAQLAALLSAAKTFDSGKLKQAEQHLNAWRLANCN